MKSRLTALLAIAIVFLMTACAGLLGPREVELPLYKLQEAMDRKFPFSNRYLEIFDISVSHPKLALQPGTNRVVTSLETVIAPSLLSNKAWTGSMELSGVLRLDPARNAIMLAEPRVDKFLLNGVDARYAKQFAQIGTLLVEQVLKNTPLYTFQPEDFKYAGTRFMPTTITTKSNSLVVTFEPAK